MDPRIDALEKRIRELEDREAIRELKARYLNACDLKDPVTVRDCFATGEVLIDYGWVGVFHDRDAFVKLFEDMGCHPQVLDMHHGANPEIRITGEDSAAGHWALHYQNINADSHALTQLAAAYDDEYVRTPDGWKIKSTRVQYLSTLMTGLDPTRTRHVGKTPP